MLPPQLLFATRPILAEIPIMALSLPFYVPHGALHLPQLFIRSSLQFFIHVSTHWLIPSFIQCSQLFVQARPWAQLSKLSIPDLAKQLQIIHQSAQPFLKVSAQSIALAYYPLQDWQCCYLSFRPILVSVRF